MKIILSRKGYDSEFGGRPSPILPDGTLVSLPIPSERDRRRYRDLRGRDDRELVVSLRDLDLFPDGVDARCHLDPDLEQATLPRMQGWRPAFGPGKTAAGHLDNQGVGVGDVFLFFGWFRRTAVVNGRLAFVPGRYQDLHVIFGWLEVGDIVRPGIGQAVPPWLEAHPHCAEHHRHHLAGRIYTATERLTISPPHPGGGVFRFDERLVLTKPGMSRSRWALDHDVFGDTEISFHSSESWVGEYFQSASKGQEFVFEANARITNWLRGFFDRLSP